MPAEAPLIAARRSPRSWRGFLASLLVHIGLIASAAWFVVSRTTSLPRGPDPSVHTVAGGREAGSETPVRKAPPPAHPAVALRRIAVASPSSVSLPDLPAAQALGGLAASSAGQGPGGLSGGRGFGGGGGQGLGLGQGLAAGFVGKPVLGATIRAQKVAVYLDCSGSMKPYLERVEASVRRALADQENGTAATRWSDALSSSGVPRSWDGVQFEPRLTDARAITVLVPPAAAFKPIELIGGATGWYAWNWLWQLRGALDLLVGGVGMRRSRPSPAADPTGWFGRAYWYALYPIHQLVFGGMLRGIAQAATASISH